ASVSSLPRSLLTTNAKILPTRLTRPYPLPKHHLLELQATVLIGRGCLPGEAHRHVLLEGDQALHQTALNQFNAFLEARRSRLYSATSGMPSVMWFTVGLGAAINMIFLWLLDIELGPHLLLAGLISFFTATMICLIANLDHPFSGHIGVS